MNIYVPVIDLSKYQGNVVDFARMARLGVKGVIVRAGNGITPDPTFALDVAAAKRAGLATGAYWFDNPKIGTAGQQGTLHANAHLAAHCELPPMDDVESYVKEAGAGPVITGKPLADWLQHKIDACEVITNRTAIIYSNQSFWDPNVGSTGFARHDIIVARYPFYSPAQCAAHPVPADASKWADWIMAATTARPHPPTGWSDWNGWQFSAGYNGMGAVYGCSSADVDLNIIRADTWARWLNIPPHPIPPTPPPPQETDMDVIVKNANGNPARYRLQDEGTLRQLSETEWTARGSIDGIAWSDAQIAAAGLWTPPVAHVPTLIVTSTVSTE